MKYRHDPKTRIIIHTLTGIVALFLSFYGIQVCPFMSTLFVRQLLAGLFVVFLFQVILREAIDHFFLAEKPTISPPRLGYYLSISVWLLSGVFAVMVHALRYPEFPFGSHVKMLVGYWALGGGIFSQFEYVLFEREYRGRVPHRIAGRAYWEKLSRRIFEGYLAFTIVPTVTLLMTVSHYVYRGFIAGKIKTEALYLGLFFISTAVFVAWKIGQSLREDTERILSGLAGIEKGDFAPSLDETRTDELGEISHGINKMASGLGERERIKEAFGKFVSPEVAHEFIERFVKTGRELSLGGTRRRAVVLYSDIRNFTPLAESMDPEKVMEYLNRYFSLMVEVVRKRGGMVDKFIGDAIMAVFGITGSSKSPETDAVAAGVEMLEALESFNALERARNMPEIEIGVGIHAGELVAGYLGSADRLEFTVIGNTVNIAARIQDRAKSPHPPLLFSREVADSVKGAFPTEEALAATLKGISGEVALHTVRRRG